MCDFSIKLKRRKFMENIEFWKSKLTELKKKKERLEMSGEDPVQLEEIICRIKEIEEKIKKLENPFLKKISQKKDRGIER
ncbi:hypothetical protein FSBG_01650 [Fusobacterium gonidiaformans 3-1-5R]|uniref:Uncharacterized protein n=2 Tax=Fusobacteriaceae TaxID=203492 RepID=E5BI30_9FUSO|nr:hypothetical protein FSBG_01650 [Fusobacterium gonidiaformans 3-1-5R]